MLEDLKLILKNLKKFESVYLESLRKQKMQPLQLQATFKSILFSEQKLFGVFKTAHSLINLVEFSRKEKIKEHLEKMEPYLKKQKDFILAKINPHSLRNLIEETLDGIITKCQDEEILFYTGVTLVVEKDIQTLLKMFKTHQYKARIVGGYVRDKLQNVTPHDVDIIVNCSQEKAKSLLTQLGYTYFISPHIPTLIQIKKTGGSYPIDIICTAESLKENAHSRDMTVNALFCDEEGNVIDPLEVIKHINEPALQIIGDIEERINQDIKIILRLIYYHFYLGKELPKNYIAAIQKHGGRLSQLPLHAYIKYMNKLFSNNEPIAVLDFLREQGLLQYLWPNDIDIINAFGISERIEQIFIAHLRNYRGEITRPDRACFVKKMTCIAKYHYHSDQDIPTTAFYLPKYKYQTYALAGVNKSLDSLRITKSPKRYPD